MCVRVNPMSLRECMWVCELRPLVVQFQLGLEPERQLAHVVGDAGLVRVLVAAGRAGVDGRHGRAARAEAVANRRRRRHHQVTAAARVRRLHAGQLEQIVPHRRGGSRDRNRRGRRTRRHR